MTINDLSDVERELFRKLPKPPTTATIRTTNIWIVEWLPSGEQPTGLLLHEWMKERRQGWSAFSMCKSKLDVIRAIEQATNQAQQTGMIPVLHIEAHGGQDGLEGPDGTGGTELLDWDELTQPLQHLNAATHCNLIVVVAACVGFAGVKALVRGPRAPAIALVGPGATVTSRDLFSGARELYRRWQDDAPILDEIAASATQQVGTVTFEVEPFAILAYEASVEQLIVSMRPHEQRMRRDRIRQKMLAENKWSAAEIEHRLAHLRRSAPPKELQRIWDEMFMIDLYPENQERFGVDMIGIAELLTGAL